MDKTSKQILGLIFYSVVFMAILPSIALFIFGGAEESVNYSKFYTYGVLGGISTVSIISLLFLKKFGAFKEGTDYNLLNYVGIHDPEKTYLGKTFDFIKNGNKLTFVMLIVALVFGSFVAISGTFVSGVPTFVEGQVTETAQGILAVEPAVSSETLLLNFWMFNLPFLAVAWLLIDEFKWQLKNSIIVGKFIGFIFATASFLFYHNLRYPNSEASQAGVLVLGGITNGSYALTNSIIISYAIHASGNLFQELANIFANEFIIAYTIIAVPVIITVYVLLFEPFGIGE